MSLFPEYWGGPGGGDSPPRSVYEEPQAAAEASWPDWPAGMWVGTSSWSFPGWAGIVYDRKYSDSKLAQTGLSAYAHHPLLRAVGIDRSFYGPVSLAEHRQYAEQVPDDFRFLVKAPERLTTARFSRHPRYGPLAGEPNPEFLSLDLALQEWIEPARQGLGRKLGCLLLQFPPTSAHVVGGPAGFAMSLHRLLEQLPSALPLAVEIRNRELFGQAYLQVLERLGVSHSLVVHPSMPPIAQQFAAVGPQALTVIRWMLGLSDYNQAVRRYQPFDRLVDEDPSSRSAILEIWRRSLEHKSQIVTVVNNKAEGCSPKSIERLAEQFHDPLCCPSNQG